MNSKKSPYSSSGETLQVEADNSTNPDFVPNSINSAPNTQPLTPNTPNSDPADTAEKPDSAGSPTH